MGSAAQTRIGELAAEDRALLSLVLQHGRTYDELAASLHTDRNTLRRRTLAVADRLVASDQAPPADERQQTVDYLLWQQTHRERVRTCSALADSPLKREWAMDLAGALAPLSEVPLPAIPGSNLPVWQPSPAEVVVARPAIRLDRRYAATALVLLAVVARVLRRRQAAATAGSVTGLSPALTR